MRAAFPRRLSWPARGRAARGFTLIEVLVALGIVAIALMAGTQATSALTRNAQRQTDMLLGQLCAENALVRMRLSAQMPPVGDSSATCEQAGKVFNVTLVVRPTPNPSFRRADVRISDGQFPVMSITSIVGRY
ncbi:MAG: type II secretion system minor pseudopilin GspI [Comamonas sp.]